MAKMKGMDKPAFVQQWRSHKKVGAVSAIALAAVLAGCQSNMNNPSIENASFSNGASVDGSASSASDGSSSAGNAGTSSQPSTYQVRSGDTLYSIAWRENMKYDELARINNIQPPYAIHVGQELKLSEGAPSGNSGATAAVNGTQTQGLGDDSAPIQSSNTNAGQSGQAQQGSGQDDSWLLPSSNTGANSSGQQVNATQSGNNAAQGATVNAGAAGAAAAANANGGSSANNTSASNSAQNNSAGQVAKASQAPKADPNRKYTPAKTINWQWPAQGRLIKRFSDSSNITAGIDIAGQQGTPVHAAGPGLVVYAGDGVRGYGNLVIIKHNNAFLSAYAHNNALNVKEGDVVVTGQQIATMGSTEADQVNLHFEVRQDGKPRDPLNYLPKQQ